MKYLIALLALITPAAPVLANQVALESTVFVERSVEQADGSVTVTLEEPARVVPGDTLIFVLTYENTGSEPAENFVVTNPMPEAVVFVEAIDSGAIYSVDGGTTFGALETLRVASDSGVERELRPLVARGGGFFNLTHVAAHAADPQQTALLG